MFFFNQFQPDAFGNYTKKPKLLNSFNFLLLLHSSWTFHWNWCTIHTHQQRTAKKKKKKAALRLLNRSTFHDLLENVNLICDVLNHAHPSFWHRLRECLFQLGINGLAFLSLHTLKIYIRPLFCFLP